MLSKKDLVASAEFPVYSSESSNSGVIGYTNSPEFICDEVVPFYVTFGDHTRTFNIVRKSFSVLDNVKVLRPNFKNINAGLFIISSWQKQIPNLGYARHWKVARKSKISLPITIDGTIDFDFIESFATALEMEQINNVQTYIHIVGLDNDKLTKAEEDSLARLKANSITWSKHKLDDLFDKIKTKKLPYKAKELPSEANGDFVLPCLTSSFRNQGLNYYVPKANATVLKDVITIPSNSDIYRAYFQSNEFTVLSDAYAIRWKSETHKLTHNQYLFMTMCINKVTDLPIYSYKNKLGGWEVVKHKYIQLPQKGDDIDFEFMDNLINAIKKLKIIKLHHFIHKKINSEIKSDYITSEREHSLAAEPYEVYGYSDFEASSKFTESEPILVGCFKSPEHLRWILSKNKYNVRLGDRAGAMDEHKELFARTSKLVLYNVEEPTEIQVMEISDPKEITGRQINELAYPEIRPEDYTYEIFNVHPSNESGNQYSDLVKEIISKPGHIEGAPIFVVS